MGEGTEVRTKNKAAYDVKTMHELRAVHPVKNATKVRVNPTVKDVTQMRAS
jgi:hypothetical protein